MNSHRRLIVAAFILFGLLVGAGGLLIYHLVVPRVLAVTVDRTSIADMQVCSHVNPAPYVMYPGGDWKSPAVAAVAQGASPLVQDAYFAAGA